MCTLDTAANWEIGLREGRFPGILDPPALFTKYSELDKIKMNSNSEEKIRDTPLRERYHGFDAFDFLCSAALLLSFVLMSFMPIAPSKYGDIYFYEEAKNLSSAIRGEASWSEIAIPRAPGPALYYGLPYLLVRPGSPDHNYWRIAVGWNALWMVVAILLIRRAGATLGSANTGKSAAVVALMLPLAVYYSFGIAAETPGYVAAAMFVYGWAKWRSSLSPLLFSRGPLISMAGLVALLLCRPNAIVILGIAALCGLILWGRRSTRETADRRFAVLCMSTGIACVLLTSVALKYMPGKRGVNPQASNFTYVMIQGSFQFRTEPRNWSSWDKRSRAGSVDYQNWANTEAALATKSKETGIPSFRLQSDWLKDDIISHPWTHLKMSAVRLLAMNIWIVNSTQSDHFRVGSLHGLRAYLLFHAFVNALAVLPVLGSIWFLVGYRKHLASYWPLWGLWLGLLLFHALVYAEPR
jgi:hypothetical protein